MRGDSRLRGNDVGGAGMTVAVDGLEDARGGIPAYAGMT